MKVVSSFDKDREYLIEKFRNPSILPEDSGIPNEAILPKLQELAMQDLDQSMFLAKARLFKFFAENMRIDVNEHDWFPALCCFMHHKRPMSEGMSPRVNAYLKREMPGLLERFEQGFKTGVERLYIDYDHSAPDWDSVFSLGFSGMLKRIQHYHRLHRDNGTLNEEAEDFFVGMETVYQTILATIDRTIQYGRTHSPEHPRVQEVCASLSRLRNGTAESFYDAMMQIYLYFIFCEQVDHIQVRSIHVDALLEPYFQRDIAAGILSEAEARELLRYFLMQWASIGHAMGNPLYFGGTNPDGSCKISRLSYLIMEEYVLLNIPTPKMQVKLDDNTPADFVDLCLDAIRHGRNSIVFINEQAIRRNMLELGYSPDEARDFDVTGCYEYAVKNGGENVTQSIYCNMLKMIELALNDGVDPATGDVCGLRTGTAETLTSFSDFHHAFIKQLKYRLEEICRCADRFETNLQRIYPALVHSGTVEHSLQVAQDAYSTGSLYNTTMLLCVGFATTVDALMAVKEFVYDRKVVTLSELRDICRTDWKGHEKLRLQVLKSPNKFGNNVEEVDFFAGRLAGFLGNAINLRPNARGGFYIASSHPAYMFIELGSRTGATPDGRHAGEEMSKNISPTIGMDRNGVTAMIQSAISIDSARLPGNFTLDVMLHPSSVQGSDGLQAMHALLDVYRKHNGNALQFNIFDEKMLRDAQKHPEKYAELRVRVCGWNVRFNDLPTSEQNAYIERAGKIVE